METASLQEHKQVLLEPRGMRTQKRGVKLEEARASGRRSRWRK